MYNTFTVVSPQNVRMYFCHWLPIKAKAYRAGCRNMLLTILSRDCPTRPGGDDTLAPWWSLQGIIFIQWIS